MRKSRKWTVSIGVMVATSTLLALHQGSSRAAEKDWTPSEASVLVDSTNFTITIGSVTDECHAASGKGTLGKESSTWSFTPEFEGCTDAIKVKGSWTASDVSSSEATFKTSEESKSLVIEAPSCELTVKSGSVIGASSDYTNGENGLEKPSSLEIASQSVSVTQSPKGCLKVVCQEVTTATITADWNIFNLTSTTEAIKVS